MSKSTLGSNRTSRAAISRRAFLGSVATTGVASALTIVSGGLDPTKAAAQSAASKAGPFLPPRFKASRPVTLKWWHWHGWHAETHKKLVAEYQKLYDPNVSLDSTAFPDYLQAVQATRTAVVGGAGPDIICPPPLAELVGYVKSNYLVPMDDYFNVDPGWKEAFYPLSITNAMVDGKIWYVTPINNAIALWYNKTVLRKHNLEVPQTLDDLKKAASVLTPAGIFPLGITGNPQWVYHPFISWMVNAIGAANVIRQADFGKASWTHPKLVEAMSLVEELAKAKIFPPGVLGIKPPDLIMLLATGKAAMALDGTWIRTTLAKSLPQGTEIGFTLLPAVQKGGERVASIGVGITLAINKASENAEMAASFARFVTSGRGRVLYVSGVGIPASGPTTPDEDREIAGALNDPMWKDCVEVQRQAKGIREVWTPRVLVALQRACEAVLIGRLGAKAALEEVEVTSKAVGERDFSVPHWSA